MKKIMLICVMLLCPWLSALSQEVQFSAAVVPSGGSSSSKGEVNISRWRIGAIHVITLPNDVVRMKPDWQESNTLTVNPREPGWAALLYPNPVSSLLTIQFQHIEQGTFIIEITDLAGQKVLLKKETALLPGQMLMFDLTGLPPATYVLKILFTSDGSRRLFKLSKI